MNGRAVASLQILKLSAEQACLRFQTKILMDGLVNMASVHMTALSVKHTIGGYMLVLYLTLSSLVTSCWKRVAMNIVVVAAGDLGICPAMTISSLRSLSRMLISSAMLNTRQMMIIYKVVQIGG